MAPRRACCCHGVIHRAHAGDLAERNFCFAIPIHVTRRFHVRGHHVTVHAMDPAMPGWRWIQMCLMRTHANRGGRALLVECGGRGCTDIGSVATQRAASLRVRVRRSLVFS